MKFDKGSPDSQAGFRMKHPPSMEFCPCFVMVMLRCSFEYMTAWFGRHANNGKEQATKAMRLVEIALVPRFRARSITSILSHQTHH